jgi:hypothetical protein
VALHVTVDALNRRFITCGRQRFGVGDDAAHRRLCVAECVLQLVDGSDAVTIDERIREAFADVRVKAAGALIPCLLLTSYRTRPTSKTCSPRLTGPSTSPKRTGAGRCGSLQERQPYSLCGGPR